MANNYTFSKLTLSERTKTLLHFLKKYYLTIPWMLFVIGIAYACLHIRKVFKQLTFLIAIFSLMIVSLLILTGRIAANTRYYVPAIFAFIPTISSGLSYLEKILKKHLGITSYFIISAILLFSLIPQIYKTRITAFHGTSNPTQSIVECRNWLRSNLEPSESVFLDYLLNWDQYFHAEIDDIKNRRVVWSYSDYPPPSKTLNLAIYDDPSELRQAIGVDFIAINKPRYIVIASEERYNKIRRITFIAKHLKHSYIREFMDLAPEGNVTLNIYGRKLPLKKRFSNQDFTIYEVFYDKI